MGTHPRAGLRLCFALFHLTLGAVVFVQSAATLQHGLQGSLGGRDPHAVIVGGIEALGALLFLWPRTLRLGGGLMLATFAIASAVHGIQPTLLVYAAGVVFVIAHGSVWGVRSPAATAG